MTIRIGSNTLSLNAQRRLADTTAALAATHERLSSGQRINKASDDAAGLSIASSLQTDSRVFSQAIRNVNDGLSLLNIGDAAVGELSSVVIRIRELAEQSANGTYTASQRQAMDAEAQALSKEFFRISRSANFNGLGLFDGSMEGGIRLQAGYGIEGSIQSGMGSQLGKGSFGAKTTYAVGTNWNYAPALADLNGDQVMDLVTAGGLQGQANVQLGVGNGLLGAATRYATETGPTAGRSYDLALGDLNGDGVLDMVTAGYVSAGVKQGQASVLLGRGDGSFGEAVAYATETGTHDSTSLAVTVGDLDGDGILDLVTAGYRRTATQSYSQVSLFFGNGDGTFKAKVTFAALTASGDSSAMDVVLGDLDGDNVLDLIASGSANSGTWGGQTAVFLGCGDGTFAPRATYRTDTGTVSGGTRALGLGDLNGDGVLDLVTAGSARNGAPGTGMATVLLGRGDGSFSEHGTYATETGTSVVASNMGSYDVALGDVNGDGILDFVTAGYTRETTTSQRGRASIFLGNGDGTFGEKATYSTQVEGLNPGVTLGVCLGDVSGDGILDLIAAGFVPSAQVSILTGLGRDGVAPILPFSLKTMADAKQAMGMLDRKLDSLSAQRGTIGAFQSRLQVAANNLTVSRENFHAAGGRIKDTDVAAESSNLVRTQILQQAASAVLAQANQQPALAIQLLGG